MSLKRNSDIKTLNWSHSEMALVKVGPLCQDGNEIYITLYINGTLKRAILDTGSIPCFLNENYAQQIRSFIKPIAVNKPVIMANGMKMDVTKGYDMRLCFADMKRTITFLLLPDSSDDIVVGMEFLTMANISLTCAGQKLLIKEVPLKQEEKPLVIPKSRESMLTGFLTVLDNTDRSLEIEVELEQKLLEWTLKGIEAVEEKRSYHIFESICLWKNLYARVESQVSGATKIMITEPKKAACAGKELQDKEKNLFAFEIKLPDVTRKVEEDSYFFIPQFTEMFLCEKVTVFNISNDCLDIEGELEQKLLELAKEGQNKAKQQNGSITCKAVWKHLHAQVVSWLSYTRIILTEAKELPVAEKKLDIFKIKLPDIGLKHKEDPCLIIDQFSEASLDHGQGQVHSVLNISDDILAVEGELEQ